VGTRDLVLREPAAPAHEPVNRQLALIASQSDEKLVALQNNSALRIQRPSFSGGFSNIPDRPPKNSHEFSKVRATAPKIPRRLSKIPKISRAALQA
jgi:hypothetical protein